MKRTSDFLLSILVPVFNEQDNVQILYERISKSIDSVCRYELIFIDDGSADRTLHEIKTIRAVYDNVHYLALSRNFGHQNSLKAGLDFCSGDVTVTMDGDLQHPPEVIPEMIRSWQEGYDVVIAMREKVDERWMKILTSRVFYRIFNAISNVELKLNSADFRLLDRKVVETLKRFREDDIFLRGVVAWSGFQQSELPYAQPRRNTGSSKYTFKKTVRLALGSLVGFTILPLRIAIVVGLLTALMSFGYGMYAVLIRIFTDQTTSGWASIMAGIYFLGGVQIIFIGVLGEYIGRIFRQVKRRPLYVVADTSLSGDRVGSCSER